MIKSGAILIFNIDKISLLDVNELIDKDRRFTLAPDLGEDEYDNLEEVLKNEV